MKCRAERSAISDPCATLADRQHSRYENPGVASCCSYPGLPTTETPIVRSPFVPRSFLLFSYLFFFCFYFPLFFFASYSARLHAHAADNIRSATRWSPTGSSTTCSRGRPCAHVRPRSTRWHLRWIWRCSAPREPHFWPPVTMGSSLFLAASLHAPPFPPPACHHPPPPLSRRSPLPTLALSSGPV